MARFQQNFSDSNNGWDVTVYWECEYGDTTAYMWWEVNQNSYGRTFAVVESGNSSNKINSGTYLTVGKAYYLQVFKNGAYSQQDGPFTITTPGPPTYTLYISQGTGVNISVKRNGVALYSGATITQGDSLSITISAETGYDIETRSHNDGVYTVYGDVNVYATAEKKTYILSISQGTGTTISVKRNGTALSNGATITRGDSLVITISANAGYDLASRSHDDGTYSVSGNISVSATATVKSFKLTIDAGTGSSITVNRTSSPKQGATTGNLSNGATIYYSDVLKITFGALTGYDLASNKVNNSTFASGDSYTVTAAVSVKSTATVKSFKLSISADTGSTITVNRTSSPKANATTGNLVNGATVYYSDVLKIVASADLSYEIEALLVNGNAFTSGNSHTVVGAVSVVTSMGRLGLAYINGEQYIIVIDEETEWVQCIPQVDNKTGWDICS